MTKSEPRTHRQFRDWLEDTFDDLDPLCQYADPDDFDQMEIAQQVEQASRLACRFGAGDLIESEEPRRTPREALAIVGRLLARMNEKWDKPSDLLAVGEVARLFDISPRTVWRRVAAGEIPQPVSLGGLTKWRREEIQATIDLLTPMKR
jgi:predicted DNA-binding transcriptional regulator AlpA